MHIPGETEINSTSVATRAMARSDVSAVLSILAESPEASAWSEKSLLEPGLSGAAWVAMHDGSVIGFLIGRAAADEFEILNLAVARSARRQGIATLLVQAALKWSCEAETRRAYLEVRASNEPAIVLYERNGFRPCGRRPRYYEHPVEDAVVLSRDNYEMP